MEQLIAALNGYDPNYKQKVKLVVETVENELSKQKQFSAVNVNRYLEFDGARDLRLLARSGFLEVVSEKGEKVIRYARLDTWPPHSDFFGGSPIGVAYYLQRWFRYGLQEWINKRMRELESKEGVYSLEQWRRFCADHQSLEGGASCLQAIVKMEPEMITRGVVQVLTDSKVEFCGCQGTVAEGKLDLLDIRVSFPSKFGKTAP
jgi:hypothetical protein